MSFKVWPKPPEYDNPADFVFSSLAKSDPCQSPPRLDAARSMFGFALSFRFRRRRVVRLWSPRGFPKMVGTGNQPRVLGCRTGIELCFPVLVGSARLPSGTFTQEVLPKRS